MSKSKQHSKPRWTATIANETIANWKKSKLSQTAFCRREEISLSTLNYWIRKTGRTSRSSRKNQSFMEIETTLPPLATPSISPIELVTPSGLQVRLASGFSSDDLSRALSVLSESC